MNAIHRILYTKKYYKFRATFWYKPGLCMISRKKFLHLKNTKMDKKEYLAAVLKINSMPNMRKSIILDDIGSLINILCKIFSHR